jgi:hypothetical protein
MKNINRDWGWADRDLDLRIMMLRMALNQKRSIKPLETPFQKEKRVLLKIFFIYMLFKVKKNDLMGYQTRQRTVASGTERLILPLGKGQNGGV